jgi:hypothetical protein
MDTRKNERRFDFDYWRRLAAGDPAAFEAARTQAIATVIDAAPAARQQRMRGLQWRIDRMREQTSNPMAACFLISDMMWNSLLGRGGLLEALRDLQGVNPDGPHKAMPGKIIALNFGRVSEDPSKVP